MRSRARVRVGVAALVALGACSSSGSFPDSAPTSAGNPTTTTATAPATTSGSAPASFSELANRLVSKVQAEFALQPDEVGDTGPSDLAKAVKDDGSPDAETVLKSEGFVRGYQRLWVGPQDAEVIVFVYQFATAAGAKRDFAREKAALDKEAPAGSHPFSVAGLKGATYAAVAGTSTDVSAAIVLFTTGPYDVQVVTNGPAPAGLEPRATKTALDQYALLRR